jgi:hypothetical protein
MHMVPDKDVEEKTLQVETDRLAAAKAKMSNDELNKFSPSVFVSPYYRERLCLVLA